MQKKADLRAVEFLGACNDILMTATCESAYNLFNFNHMNCPAEVNDHTQDII